MALLSQTQMGQFLDKHDLDRKISSCIMSALACDAMCQVL